MKIKRNSIGTFLLISILANAQVATQVQKTANTKVPVAAKDEALKSCCVAAIPNRFASKSTPKNPEGMVWIPAGTFSMGGDSDQARKDEFPKHSVQVNGFFMDVTEVTNAQFEKFVAATAYVTTAEKDIDWEELKKQLSANASKPDEETLKAASLVFVMTQGEVSLQDYSQWWQWTHGANWRHPKGKDSDIVGKENLPVVHISWDDANAYCKWSGKRLPTEAEWEYASRGGLDKKVYAWGNEKIDEGKSPCNYWQGSFPYQNEVKDGFFGAAPIKSFQPNGYGLYDMAGNVWEWCADLYNNTYYDEFEKTTLVTNPQGPSTSYDPDEPMIAKRVMRGGSFLCSDSYCSGYRVAARMKSSADSSMEHLGFRCVSNN